MKRYEHQTLFLNITSLAFCLDWTATVNIDMKLIDVRMKKLFFLFGFMKNCKKSDFYSACWCTTIWHKMHMTAGNIIKETSTIIIILMMIKEQKPSRCLCWDVVRNRVSVFITGWDSAVCWGWWRVCSSARCEVSSTDSLTRGSAVKLQSDILR